MKRNKSFYSTLILLLMTQNENVEASSYSLFGLSPLNYLAFAGGGFGSKTNKSKKKTKKKGGLLANDDLTQTTTNFKTKDSEEQVLDRFGLPVRTAENFFPPLPDDSEIIGVDVTEKTSLSEVRIAMESHIPLSFDLFDEEGLEKNKSELKRKPWKLSLLHKSPPVISIDNFFTPEECEEYIGFTTQKGSNKDESALEVDSATFSPLAQSKRTSTTWFCYYSQAVTLLAKVKRLLNNLPLEQMEEVQVVRYRKGEEFSWHYDEIPGPQLSNGGQRVATILVYLNTIDKEKGGGTVFRDLKDPVTGTCLTMRPKLGSALLFFPAFGNGIPDDRTLHKGEVAIDEKMIAQMWVHEKSYTPVVPSGNRHDDARERLKTKETELGFF